MPKAVIPPHTLRTAAADGSERYPAQPARVSLVDSHGVWVRTVCASELLRTRVLAAFEEQGASSDASPSAAGTPTTATIGHVHAHRPVVARLCEHFEGHGTCNRGHKCRFAHRVGPPQLKESSVPQPFHDTPVSHGAPVISLHHPVLMSAHAARVPTTPLRVRACSEMVSEGFNPSATHSTSQRARSAFATSTESARRPAAEVIVVSRGGRCWRHAAYDAKPLWRPASL